MQTLWLDLETYSPVDIKRGTYAYAEKAEVLLFAYAIDDAPVRVWDVTQDDSPPAELAKAWRTGILAAHNAQFDRVVLEHTNLLPPAHINRWLCTKTQALCHNLPGSLGELSAVFALPVEQAKDKRGKALIRLFCSPQKDGTRATAKTHPAEWAEFIEYAASDILAMRQLHKMMPQWNYPKRVAECQLYALDQTINDRGFAVDVELGERAVAAAVSLKRTVAEAAVEATGGAVDSPSATAKLKEYIAETFGVELPNLQADTVQTALTRSDLHPDLRELLVLRLEGSRSTSAKYKAALSALSFDGRLRGTLQFRGASLTGRYTGKIFQPQNLMRPTMSEEMIEDAIETVKSGMADLVYDNLAEVLGNTVRGIIIAPPKHKLLVCDLSAIEGRLLAWLAGDERIVQFYRDFDAGKVNYDSYLLAYAQAFGVDPSTMSKKTHKDERQLGKPIELSLGYGGGVSAFVTFAQTYHIAIASIAEAVYAVAPSHALRDAEAKYEWAKGQGFHAGLPLEQYAACEYIKTAWRISRQPTVGFWERLQDAWALACAHEKEVFTVNAIKMQRIGSWLRIRLPSGRFLCFQQPKVTADGCSFLGRDQTTKRFIRQPTHGGKLAGWITQAVANDILNAGLMRAEAAGMPVVLSVHDELVCEVRQDSGYSIADLEACMVQENEWAVGLPLKAEGFEAMRYRK